MEKKNVVFLTVLAIATLLTAVVGTTFAYFTATVSGTGQATTITTASDLGITYSDGAQITGTNITPGWHNPTTKTVTVHNDSNITMHYQLNLSVAKNTFVQGSINGTEASGNTDDLVYSVERTAVSDSATTQVTTGVLTSGATTRVVASGFTKTNGKAYSLSSGKATVYDSTAGSQTEVNVAAFPAAGVDAQHPSSTIIVGGNDGVEISAGATHTYVVSVYFLETGVNQNENQSLSETGTCAKKDGESYDPEPNWTTITNSADCTTANGTWTQTRAAAPIELSATLGASIVAGEGYQAS